MTRLIIFIFGLAIGSFLNVILSRFYQGESFLGKRSYCPQCKKKISWYDNIPLLSFLFLKGRCRHCQSRISWQYPLVELATGVIFVLLYLQFGLTLKFFNLIIFSCFLLIIFIYDLKHYLILDKITIPAMIVAILLNLYLGLSLWQLILAGLVGGGFFLIQFLISSGRWIGGGDIRLGFLMGLMLAWPMLLVALFLAYLLGAVIGIILIAAGRKKMSSQIPFGTFLTLATFLTFLFGPQLLDWYLNLINF